MKTLKRFTRLMTVFTIIAFLSSFTLAVGATVTVTSPNGGETFTAGTTTTVTWTSDTVGNVRVVLLKGGLQRLVIASAIPNNGSFNWLVPTFLATGTDYTVKISICTNPLITDVSDTDFTINGAGGSVVAVTAPNGGENWTVGTTNTVTWTSDITGNVRIVLLKGGLQRLVIASAIPSSGSFDWLIPAYLATGTDYTVKISSCIDPLVADVSDADFTINGAGGTIVTVTSPNGGETWTAGTTNPVTWTSDIVGNVRIVLLKAGVQRALIAAAIPNSGSFNWLIPAGIIGGTDYTVKISSCINPLVSDVSDANFTIGGGIGSTVAVTSPNGGEVWTSGTTNPVTWTSDIVGNVRIVLLKGGVQRALIAAAIPNSGSFNWLIPACIASGTDYTVKISSCSNAMLYDVSDATFTINGSGGTTLTLTAPNGGETWTAGTTNTVTWTSDIVGNVRIVLLKGGVQCSLISFGIPNSGSYSWLIPAGIIPGTDYTVKISSCFNPLLTDVSDTTFSIVPADNSSLKMGVGADNPTSPVLTLYPNPASDKINITSDRDMSRVSLLNDLGQVVLETAANTRQLQMNVIGFSRGIYFVRIETEGTTITRKVFVK